MAVGLMAVGFASAPPRAGAVILPPTTVDGPSTGILEFGGITMASDGSGGLVYVKAVEGTPHVFAARYAGGHWGPPVRVDGDQPFEASQPRIAAEPNGRLLVVWVTQDATVKGRVQYGLYSATMGPGASGFGRSLLVDPNLGSGLGADPALAGASSGRAIVAYRVITNTFQGSSTVTGQLRPGDVMAEVRLARLSGERWSRLGAVNRNPAASMRPPSEENAPEVGVGASGNAVVAWQEPDQTGTARIWARRIFGSTLGPPIQASPSTWEGQAVSGDADAFALDVTEFDQARIVSRVDAGGALSAPRMFLGTLGPSYAEGASKLEGPQLADGGASPGVLGAPAVAASGGEGGSGAMRLGFVAGGAVRRFGVDAQGKLTQLPSLTAPTPAPGAEVAAAVGAEAGGLTAYSASDALGRPAVAVTQEFPSGAAQTALLQGQAAGPIAELHAGGSGAGDALVGFRQGEPGAFEIVADRVSAPPENFNVRVPGAWVKPSQATLRWQIAPSAVGGVSYAVVLGGRVIKQGLTQRRFRPRPALLGNGVRSVQVLATDALGGQVLSKAAKLRVDSQPPTASIRAKGPLAIVRLRDAQSGVRSASCSFGDGSRPVRSRGACRHRYERPGRYSVVVRERDKAGNGITRHLSVTVR